MDSVVWVNEEHRTADPHFQVTQPPPHLLAHYYSKLHRCKSTMLIHLSSPLPLTLSTQAVVTEALLLLGTPTATTTRRPHEDIARFAHFVSGSAYFQPGGTLGLLCSLRNSNVHL